MPKSRLFLVLAEQAC